MKRLRLFLVIALLAAFPTLVNVGLAEADVRTNVGPTQGRCGL